MTREEELDRRTGLWRKLEAQHNGALVPAVLRELGVYGGAQGIWVDKARTGPLAPDRNGVTVSVLHTGRHYPDDLSAEGLVYHYPQTGRAGRRDATEIAATKAAKDLKLPVFVVLRGDNLATTRRVRLGWVADWDDTSRQFLILFGITEPPYSPAPDESDPFALTDITERRLGRMKVRAGQQQFRFNVLKRYGCKCAVCPITHPQLIVAAHIRGKSHSGSDDWRNGLPLCHTHHAAFDAGLFDVQPETHQIILAPGITVQCIGLTSDNLTTLRNVPHMDALRWRWNSSGRAANTEDAHRN
jgi:putative restriction endonuclease